MFTDDLNIYCMIRNFLLLLFVMVTQIVEIYQLNFGDK